MTTDTLTASATQAPSVRARSRRALDISPPVTPENPADSNGLEALMAQARALAEDVLAANEQARAAEAVQRAKLKELAALCGTHELPKFTIERGGKTYDCGEIAEETKEVDPVLLFDLVTKEEFLKLVKVSQGVVTDQGGKTLLNRVLKSITKPVEFKVKKRA